MFPPDLLTGDHTDEDHMDSVSVAPALAGPVWPAYVDITPLGFYRCLWCESSQLQSSEVLEMHLRGKDHTKRCYNSSISPYGSETHLQEVTEYVKLYGHDPYARLQPWPECIVEEGIFYVCRCCGNRKFQTQRAVNEHLLEASHIDRAGRFDDVSPMRQRPPSDNHQAASPATSSDAWMRDPAWPDCIVDDEDGMHWRCSLCAKKFNAHGIVDAHLEHPKHLAKLKGGGEFGQPSLGDLDPIRERARELQRMERLATHIDPVRRECRLCERRFESGKETDDHVEDLGHLSAFYEFLVDKVV